MRFRLRNAAVLISLFLLLGVNGCFSSMFTLGSPEEAKVSRIYVGDWALEGMDATTLSIRSFDEKSYVVALVKKDDDGSTKFAYCRGFLADVKDVTFAHLKPLGEDGKLGDEWELYRIAITDGGEIVLRVLDEKYFKDKKINSNDDLKKIVEAGLDDDAMYGKKPIKGRRVKTGTGT